MSLFIGLRGINGTLTVFLGLLTDFKRKLDLTVVAIPPKAGKSLPLLCNRKPAYTALAQWPQGQIRLKSVRKPCCSSLKLIYRQNLCRFACSSRTRYQLDLRACQQFIHIILGMTCKVRTGKQENIQYIIRIE